eukprot:11244.XXX_271541_271786_1 [CDS] Oithona nana genome sequencing.
MLSLSAELACFHTVRPPQTSSSGSKSSKIETFLSWRLTVEMRWQSCYNNEDHHGTSTMNPSNIYQIEKHLPEKAVFGGCDQ